MRLHDHPRSSNAQKVRFLLGVLGLEYERRTVPFAPPRPDWHLAVNPLGGIPALIDGELVLAESNAILRYLAAREGRDDLLPVAARERAPVDWVLDAVATMLRPACPRGRRARLRLPAAARHRRGGAAARRGAGRDRARRPAARGVHPPAGRAGAMPATGASRWPTAPRCPRSGGCCTPGRSPGTHGCACGPRRSPRTPRGRRSPPRAAYPRDHEPRKRPRQGRARARRGQGAPAHRACSLDEGEDALRAALAAGIAPVEAFVDDDLGKRPHRRRAPRGGHRGAALLDRGDGGALVALAREPRGRRPARERPAAARRPAPRRREVGLQLHGVADPGNLGTLLRSAQGFGPAHVALADGCADPLSPRAVRASMGALYSVPVITLAEAPPLRVIALDARGERTLAELAPHPPVAFALGGERSGLPDAVTSAADAVARIPLADGAESLNVAIAGALALYELRRA